MGYHKTTHSAKNFGPPNVSGHLLHQKIWYDKIRQIMSNWKNILSKMQRISKFEKHLVSNIPRPKIRILSKLLWNVPCWGLIKVRLKPTPKQQLRYQIFLFVEYTLSFVLLSIETLDFNQSVLNYQKHANSWNIFTPEQTNIYQFNPVVNFLVSTVQKMYLLESILATFGQPSL